MQFKKKLAYIQVLAVLMVFLSGMSSCSKKTAEDKQSNSSGSKSGTSNLVPIKLKLPMARFVGTRVNIEGVTNLEPRCTKPREPFLAPAGVTNVALGKSVACSGDKPMMGELSWLVDDDKEATDGSLIELGPFLQHITIDLGFQHEIYAVVVWHDHKQEFVYNDVVVQVSDNKDFIDYTTIFNNDDDNSAGQGAGKDKNYVETAEGKLIDAKGIKGRFVRLYSQGNSSSDQNNYLEVAVYGKSVK